MNTSHVGTSPSFQLNVFKALIKREFWEHKGAIFYTPLIMAVVFACFMLLGTITAGTIEFENNGHKIELLEQLPRVFEKIEEAPEQDRSRVVQGVLYGQLASFGFVMLIITLFFALASLYDERKDKSILFWKSLPVSDTKTVISKFVAIVILVPVVYFVVIAAFQLFLLFYVTVAAWFGGSSGAAIWGSSNLLGVYFNSFMALVTASLWLAPFWAWLMLASSWAKKVAFMWGMLPIFMIAIAEAWIFHSSMFIEMVGKRIAGGVMTVNSNLASIAGKDVFDEYVPHWTSNYTNNEFWWGLVVAALFLAAAIYTRRFRNES